VNQEITDGAPITRSQANLLRLADACSHVRKDVGHLFLTTDESAERVKAQKELRRSIRALLQAAREEDVGLFLEVAAQLSA
jgi:hypothetical protein